MGVFAHIMSPTHAISLDLALDTLFPSSSVHCDLFLAWPGLPEIDEETRGVVKTMLSCSKHFYSFIDNVPERGVSFSHIFYPHDVSGDAVCLAVERFPNALRVCVGDALGTICDREHYFNNLIARHRPSTTSVLRKIRQTLSSFSRKRVAIQGSIKPDIASLIIPVDLSGKSLRGVKLLVPEIEKVRTSILRMSAAFPKLSEFAVTVQEQRGSQKCFTLLMQNSAECGTISIEREIEMCATIIRQIAPVGSLIVLKGHPGEKFDRFDGVSQRLGNDFRFIKVPPHLKRIPLELWTDLIEISEFIGFSYSTVSLRYLFGKEVVNPVSPDFIARWFDKVHWESYIASQKAYQIPIHRLETWKGNGPLASGPF